MAIIAATVSLTLLLALILKRFGEDDTAVDVTLNILTFIGLVLLGYTLIANWK